MTRILEDVSSVERVLIDGIEKGGYDETSLTSLSTADYTCLEPLVKMLGQELERRNVSFSVSSLRASGVTVWPTTIARGALAGAAKPYQVVTSNPGTPLSAIVGTSGSSGSRCDADTAVFYSISNCQRGLTGVTFGSFLITK